MQVAILFKILTCQPTWYIREVYSGLPERPEIVRLDKQGYIAYVFLPFDRPIIFIISSLRGSVINKSDRWQSGSYQTMQPCFLFLFLKYTCCQDDGGFWALIQLFFLSFLLVYVSLGRFELHMYTSMLSCCNYSQHNYVFHLILQTAMFLIFLHVLNWVYQPRLLYPLN